jgi:Lrp/AsnC family leucine-responsive transcriptional regulator
MSLKLDLFDRKILTILDINSSIPLHKISSRLKRSKQFILYRMKRLEEERIITGYNAIIDMSKLGYFTFRTYIKFQSMTEKDGTKFVEFCKKEFQQVWTITSMHGKWDYALFLGVKNVSEFHEIWDKIFFYYKDYMKNYNVAVYAPIINFNRKIFSDTINASECIERIYGAGNTEKIDETDKKIIEAYASNVRQSALEIAKKLRVSPDTIRSRIKNLINKKIIVGYMLGINLEKAGYTGYRVDFQLKSAKRLKELYQYFKFHKNIYQINKSIGGADLEIETIVKNQQELLQLIDDIKEKFNDTVMDAEWFGFSIFHILKYIPD